MSLQRRTRKFNKMVSFGEEPYSSLRFLIEERRLEVKNKFKELHAVLEHQEEDLLKELNAILDKYSPKELILCNRAKSMVIPEVKIMWNVEAWIEKLSKICKFETVISPYIHKRIPLRVGVNQSYKNALKISEPRGLAVDKITQEIYFANHGADSIVVLDFNCDFLKCIQNPDLCGPWSLCLDDTCIYVACSSHTLLKINKITGLVLACVNLANFTTGVAISENSMRLYGCEYETKSVCVFTLELALETTIVLHSSYFTPKTRINDIKIIKEQICCLFQNSAYHLQIFDMDGTFKRGLVHQHAIGRGNSFCMDWNSKYFLITDGADSQIKVFSDEGQHLHNIGVMCCAASFPGSLSEPTGVAICTGNRVVVCDQKEFYAVQIF